MAAKDTNVNSLSVAERISRLHPSKDLLEFYQKKVREYDDEYDKLLEKFEEQRKLMENQYQLETNLQKQMEEVNELQKALSDMQIFLFLERENVLKLYAENDSLKIKVVDGEKKIQKLRRITDRKMQLDKNAETAQRSDTNVGVSNRMSIDVADNNYDGNEFVDSESLTLQIDALTKRLNEQSKLAADQLKCMMEDREVLQQELDSEKKRNSVRIDSLNSRLKRSHGLLQKTTKEYLDLKSSFRERETAWMNEKNQLMCQLQIITGTKSDAVDLLLEQNPPMTFVAMKQQHRTKEQLLSNQLEQSNKLAKMYRQQCLNMEEKLQIYKEQNEFNRHTFLEKFEKLNITLKLANSKYQELEKRRKFEVEGFQNDIATLRTSLRNLEKQLFKAHNVNVTDDIEVLENVKKTAVRSKRIENQLKNLKSKIYGLENDLRRF